LTPLWFMRIMAMSSHLFSGKAASACNPCTEAPCARTIFFALASESASWKALVSSGHFGLRMQCISMMSKYSVLRSWRALSILACGSPPRPLLIFVISL
jgi:hypothetical protein